MGRQATVPVSSPSCKDTELHARQWGHCETFSQSFILEEQAAWLNDLLSDTDSNWNGALHRRAASDSFTIFDGLVPLPDLDQLNETETADSCEPDDGLGSGCTYGPNSPRRKNKWSLPEKEIVSAFSEYVMQIPAQHVDGYISVPGDSDSNGDACTSATTLDRGLELENSNSSLILKRSVDILQYIKLVSDLCLRNLSYNAAGSVRTNFLLVTDRKIMAQNLGSELAVTVASIIQQNAALSMENNTLKQQLLRMQRQKFIVDNEFQSLKKEVGRLKTSLTVSANNNVYNRNGHHSQSLSRIHILAAHREQVWTCEWQPYKMVVHGKLLVLTAFLSPSLGGRIEQPVHNFPPVAEEP
ncbi:hypothetical protein Sango_2670900 [Sesamum angolense]|uniref:Uncharacterized protein n=1 Tax=Sesamum angolense TaxID=2727404 RepID=A0AAE1W2E4_9LAMI|nr:hypothetical protein Sango_2670900 [Sesamum angolense]